MTMVNGLIARKLGMTRVFTADGRWIDVTLLETGPCLVVQRKTRGQDGYDAVQLGFGEVKPQRLTKPLLGHFEKQGVTPRKNLKEFRVDESSVLKPGDEIKADLFAVGERVDVSGKSKGKGFQGVQKRHNMQGGPGGHGSMFHRRVGSIGQSADPSKVFKNKGMPGHMGSDRVTVQNLEVVSVDATKNLITVRGCVPGATGGVVQISKSVKGTS